MSRQMRLHGKEPGWADMPDGSTPEGREGSYLIGRDGLVYFRELEYSPEGAVVSLWRVEGSGGTGELGDLVTRRRLARDDIAPSTYGGSGWSWPAEPDEEDLLEWEGGDAGDDQGEMVLGPRPSPRDDYEAFKRWVGLSAGMLDWVGAQSHEFYEFAVNEAPLRRAARPDDAPAALTVRQMIDRVWLDDAWEPTVPELIEAMEARFGERVQPVSVKKALERGPFVRSSASRGGVASRWAREPL